MQDKKSGTFAVSAQGVTATGEQATTITFHLVHGLDKYCQSQQLSDWCWAAAALAAENYYTAKAGGHLTTQADMCALYKGQVVNDGGNPDALLTDCLHLGHVKYPISVPSSMDALLQFVQDAVNADMPMILIDGKSNQSSHALVILGYGQSVQSGQTRNFLAYFDPYLGYAFPTEYPSNTFVYAPFENFLNDLGSGLDQLYRYKPGDYMTPLLNAIPSSSSCPYPSWHVVNGGCNVKCNIPKSFTVDGVTYCIQGSNSCDENAKRFYYYPRLTHCQDAETLDPMSLDVYYASSVKIKRDNHSYKETLNYGVPYTDPHDHVVVIDASYNPDLGSESKDFYLFLIPVVA